jgi:hypothetical protein
LGASIAKSEAELDKLTNAIILGFARGLLKVLRVYFDLLEKAFGRSRTTRTINKILRVFEGPVATVDERISKIDSARTNLVEGLQAIDELKIEAEANKRELAVALRRLEEIQEQKDKAEKELGAIHDIAAADTSALRKAIGIPGLAQMWADRFFGFISGIFASLLASVIWWLIKG